LVQQRNLDILSFSLKKSKQENPLPVPQRGPYGERYPLTGHLYVSEYISFYLSLRVPSKGAPSMFPNRAPLVRDTPSPEPLVCFHSCMYVCRSPPKGALLHTYRKNIRSPSTEPQADGRPTYNGLRRCYLYPRAMQPSARYLPPWLG